MTQTIAILGVGIALSLESGTAQVITSPPTALVKRYSTSYNYKKYLWIPQYNIHVIGTASVSDWFMRESYSMIYNMVGAIKSPTDRAKFSGHQALLITDFDPSLYEIGQSTVIGHRNTGNLGWSMFNEALVRTTAQDTINLTEAATFRGWDTPVHEFGHAVEATLNLAETTKYLHKLNNVSIIGANLSESFAWGAEAWFQVVTGVSRSTSLPTWKYSYFASIFDVSNTWRPIYAQRPTKLPVGPLGFTYGCGESQGLNLGVVAHDVAYGATKVYNNFAYLTNRTGIVYFNVPTFGYDPYLNVLKSGFYRLRSNIVPPLGYTLCANEGGSFTLPGLSSVAYGSNGNFKFLTGRTGSVTFSPTFFGGDPNYGSLKNGFYKLGSSL